MGDKARLVWWRMIIKVLAIVFLAIILGRILVDPLIKEKRSSPEEHYLGFFSEKDSSVREIQKLLKDGGFYTGQVDGSLGEDTRRSVKAFQKKARLEATGKVDVLTRDSLRHWQGPPSDLLKEPASIPSPVLVWAGNGPERVRQVQAALKKAGYYSGKADGKSGPRTRKAIKAFQRSAGLVCDGVAGPETLARLKALVFQEADDVGR